jgi:hypothetical protein
MSCHENGHTLITQAFEQLVHIRSTPIIQTISGSSRTSSFGSSMMACAMPSRCLMPTEYLPTGFRLFGSSPNNSYNLFDTVAICFGAQAHQPFEVIVTSCDIDNRCTDYERDKQANSLWISFEPSVCTFAIIFHHLPGK